MEESGTRAWARKFLEENPDKEFTAKEIATYLIKQYLSTELYQVKLKNNYNEEGLISQISSEINLNSLTKKAYNESIIRLNTKPYKYMWSTNNAIITEQDLSNESTSLLEHDLYPKFEEFLLKEFKFKPKRINEKTSSNRNGRNSNKWLHPDIVSLEALDLEWQDAIKEVSGRQYNIHSYELKLEINKSNLRESFFQTVSNSSWANYSYLVTSIFDKDNQFLYQEFNLLSQLHGIGLIIFNPNNLDNYEILFPAKYKELDFGTINRITEENTDFKEFITDILSPYLKLGRFI